MKSVLIKACDTDILVVAVNILATLQDAGLELIWVEFGQGQSIRWLPIHDMVVNLGPEKSSGILFFHAFTGCDVVSAFRGEGKRHGKHGRFALKWALSQSIPTYHRRCRHQHPWEVCHHHVWQAQHYRQLIRQDWTCLLGSKGVMMPFHRQAHPSFSMWNGLPSKLPEYGARQQCTRCKLKALQTGAGKKMMRSGKFSGQPLHPLFRLVSSWQNAAARLNAEDDANASAWLKE